MDKIGDEKSLYEVLKSVFRHVKRMKTLSMKSKTILPDDIATLIYTSGTTEMQKELCYRIAIDC